METIHGHDIATRRRLLRLPQRTFCKILRERGMIVRLHILVSVERDEIDLARPSHADLMRVLDELGAGR